MKRFNESVLKNLKAGYILKDDTNNMMSEARSRLIYGNSKVIRSCEIEMVNEGRQINCNILIKALQIIKQTDFGLTVYKDKSSI